jgi:glycosyltransferase involved in cell wall biosynthesis
VLEPCWTGYQDWRFLLYLGKDLRVVVFAPYPPDFDFIRGLDTNLHPIHLGPGDWVDPDTFQPGPPRGRAFDLVMVSAWSPIKRHEVLFRTLAELRRRGRPGLRAALVGYPSVWTREVIETLMRKHGVEEQCTILENISHSEVARVLADSRAYLLLSRHEGTNKATYESLFCDTPVIVPRDHRGGVNPERLGPEVGVFVGEGELADAICGVLDAQRPSAEVLAEIQKTAMRAGQ